MYIAYIRLAGRKRLKRREKSGIICKKEKLSRQSLKMNVEELDPKAGGEF